MRNAMAILLLLHVTNSSIIEIGGVDRALLLAKLYKKARLNSKSPSLGVGEARRYVGTYIRRLHGVSMYIKVPLETESNYLNALAYNEANGEGLAESVVKKIRMRSKGRVRCSGFGCGMQSSMAVLASICVSATICGGAAAVGYCLADNIMDFYANDGTEHVFTNDYGPEETPVLAEHDGNADPDLDALMDGPEETPVLAEHDDNADPDLDALNDGPEETPVLAEHDGQDNQSPHVSGNKAEETPDSAEYDGKDEVDTENDGMDPFNRNAELEALNKSNEVYNAIVKDAFPSSVEQIGDFYRTAGDCISTGEAAAAKSNFVAAIAKHSNAKYIDIDYKLKETLFNSAVDDAIADSRTITDDVKRFLVDPDVKSVDSATRDAGHVREALDLIAREASVDPSNVAKERDALVDAIGNAFASSEWTSARAGLVASLRNAIESTASVAAASKI